MGLLTELASRAPLLPGETFTWDLAQPAPALLQDGTTNIINGPGGQPLEQITATGAVTYLQPDQQGSTRILTDKTGAVVAAFTYDPYGNTTATSGTATTNLRYAGQFLDAETGYYYLHARYYDPATAQFITRDPASPATQPYAYTGDNPANATDPSGQFCIPVGGIEIGFGCLGGLPGLFQHAPKPAKKPEQKQTQANPCQCGAGIVPVGILGSQELIDLAVVAPQDLNITVIDFFAIQKFQGTPDNLGRRIATPHVGEPILVMGPEKSWVEDIDPGLPTDPAEPITYLFSGTASLSNGQRCTFDAEFVRPPAGTTII